MELTTQEIAAILAIMTVAGAVQGSLGFGGTLVALPVLALINPVFAPGPLVVMGILMGGLILIRDRSAIHMTGVRFALPGQLAGIGAGLAFLCWFPPDHMNLVLGGALILAVVLSGCGLHVLVSPRSLAATGVLSGFMGTLSALGGAPLGLLYQKAPGARLRATLACLLLIGGACTAGALWLSGRLGPAEWKASLCLLPGTLAGFVLSFRAAAILDAGHIRRAVLGFAGLGGVVLIVRALAE